MAFVKAKRNEDIGSLLKRFKRAVERSGVLSDYKKHEFYEKPSVKRKKKQAAARKRALKKEKKLAARRARKGTNKNFKWNKDRTKKIPLKPKPQSSGYKGNRGRASAGPNNRSNSSGNKNYSNRSKQNYKSNPRGNKK